MMTIKRDRDSIHMLISINWPRDTKSGNTTFWVLRISSETIKCGSNIERGKPDSHHIRVVVLPAIAQLTHMMLMQIIKWALLSGGTVLYVSVRSWRPHHMKQHLSSTSFWTICLHFMYFMICRRSTQWFDGMFLLRCLLLILEYN